MTEAANMPETESPRKPTLAARLLALAFGLLLALALVEGAGRLVLGFEPLPGWAQDFKDRVGYELRPGQTYTYASQNGEFETEVRHNSRGLHDVEHTLEKAPDTFRVLILGDSYPHAREVPLETNFARQLEGLLPDHVAAENVEVINAGHFGLGTTQAYLTYVEEGRRYDPDLVLLGFYVGNDVVDNHAPLIKAWNQIDTVDFPYFDPDGTLHQPGLERGRRLASWLRNNVYIISAVADAISGNTTSDRVEVGDPAAINAQTLRVPMGVYAAPDDTWTGAWQATAHALTALRDAVTEDGATLAVFIIPDRRQVYDADWQATLDRLPDLDPAMLDRERPTDATLALLDELGIPALSLLPDFRAATERVYFEIDGHFTPVGHTLTAQALAGWIEGLGS